MEFSSAPISNKQFRPRTTRSGNLGRANRQFTVPKLTTRSGSLGLKRNARAGKKYHWAVRR